MAFLTNFREEYRSKPASSVRTRGNLTVDFLVGKEAPMDYLRRLNCGGYNGFNLFVADLGTGELGYLNNVQCTPRLLQPGMYGCGNGALDGAKWRKLEVGKRGMQELLSREALEGACE